jgi:cytochrome b561
VSDAGSSGYGTVARLLHWSVTLLVAVTIPAGIAMTSEGFEGVRNGLFVVHKGIGVVLLVLVVVRALWRFVVSPPPLPAFVPRGERQVARATHAGLYLLLLALGVTGYLRTAGGGYPVEILDALGIPPLVGEMPDAATTLSVAHKFLAWTFVATAAVHVAEVLRHTLLERDGILARMWPPVARGGG